MVLGVINEKGKLLQGAVAIIDKLSKSNIVDSDGDNEYDEKTIDDLKSLIMKARQLTSDNLWNHLK